MGLTRNGIGGLAALTLLLSAMATGRAAEPAAGESAEPTPSNAELLRELKAMEKRIRSLEKQLAQQKKAPPPAPASAPAASAATVNPPPASPSPPSAPPA